MKLSVKLPLSLASMLLVLVSCATFMNAGPPFTPTVSSLSQDDLVQVSVPSLEAVNKLSTGLQVVGVDIQVRNNSDKTLIIRWADSSIDYNGKSHMVFLNGHYYSDAGRVMPDTHVSPGREVTNGVIPTDNVPPTQSASYASNQAPFDPIYSKDITCHISINLGGEDRYQRGENSYR